jgi:hypothetical protein
MEHINKISGQSPEVLVIATSGLCSIVRRVIAQPDSAVFVFKDARLTTVAKQYSTLINNLTMFRHTHVSLLVPYST